MHSRLTRHVKRTIALAAAALTLAALMPAGTAFAAPPTQDDTGSDETPPSEEVVYTVQPGDTLFKISLRFNVPMSTLIARNGIINPSHVWVGQRLIISDDPGEAAPAATEEPAAEPIRHVVQPGEILSRIANQYGVPMSAIIAANGITNPSVLFWGTVLTIPVTAEPVTVAEATADEPAAEEVAEAPAEEPAAEEPAAEEAPAEEVVAEAPAEEIVAQSAEEPAAEEVAEAPAEEAPAEEAPAEPAVAQEAPTTQPYTVVAGDTLYKVALRFGTTTAYLMSINQIANINHIEVGQTLTVPSSPTGDSPPPVVAQSAPVGPAAPSSTGKQILVDLSEQMTYAYEDGVLLRSFLVSTGLPATPTVVGDFNIYVKYRAVRMTGPGYDLPNVPYTMYFYAGYGLHGTYWHNNFGHPMSHGCVNLRTPDAEWLYNWAPVGTPVRVVY